MTTKLLVSGDVKGSLDQLIARAATVHGSKGPFDCLLCVGDFFGGADAATALEPFKAGTRIVPLPTYVLGSPPPAAPPPDADGKLELAPDLYCLVGTGIVTLHGLRVAFAAQLGDEQLTEAVAELRSRVSESGYTGCDLLLTQEWPRGFYRKLPIDAVPADVLPDRDLPEVGSERIAEMAASVRPRYHFCATQDTFFARAPYRQGGGTSVCRLICLAGVNPDPKRKKWLHALALAPMATMAADQLAAAPENTTDSPYPYAPPAPPGAAAAAPVEAAAADGADAQGKKRKRPEFAKEQRAWVSEQCWFCMASPKFESHLVVSVGEEIYACLAKGPLLPLHALLLPIAHKPCSVFLSDSEAAELERYISALRQCFAARATPALLSIFQPTGAVTSACAGAALLLFERYMANGTFEHMHLQAIPVPSQLAAGARAAFEAHGQRLGLRFEVLSPSETVASRLAAGPEPFFAATLPSGETLLHLHRTNPRRHPLQFGREVVATLLGNPARADWKMCMPCPAPGERATPEALETRAADEFKKAFAAFELE